MNNLKIKKQLLPGVFLLDCPHYFDPRGSLTKIFHSESLNNHGIDFVPAESFVTRSAVGVLRGMHFQVGKVAHDKLVYCIRGHVLDVVVDIQPERPNFNQPASIELNADDPIALFIPKGYAHGFLSLQEDSLMLYSTSTIHSPEHDRGVFWSSINFNWPTHDPLLSQRDREHPSIHELV